MDPLIDLHRSTVVVGPYMAVEPSAGIGAADVLQHYDSAPIWPPLHQQGPSASGAAGYASWTTLTTNQGVVTATPPAPPLASAPLPAESSQQGLAQGEQWTSTHQHHHQQQQQQQLLQLQQAPAQAQQHTAALLQQSALPAAISPTHPGPFPQTAQPGAAPPRHALQHLAQVQTLAHVPQQQQQQQQVVRQCPQQQQHHHQQQQRLARSESDATLELLFLEAEAVMGDLVCSEQADALFGDACPSGNPDNTRWAATGNAPAAAAGRTGAAIAAAGSTALAHRLLGNAACASMSTPDVAPPPAGTVFAAASLSSHESCGSVTGGGEDAAVFATQPLPPLPAVIPRTHDTGALLPMAGAGGPHWFVPSVAMGSRAASPKAAPKRSGSAATGSPLHHMHPAVAYPGVPIGRPSAPCSAGDAPAAAGLPQSQIPVFTITPYQPQQQQQQQQQPVPLPLRIRILPMGAPAVAPSPEAKAVGGSRSSSSLSGSAPAAKAAGASGSAPKAKKPPGVRERRNNRRKAIKLPARNPGRGLRCRNCHTCGTPQWRAGPDGPKTLCNACGVKYKKGLPLEYLEARRLAAEEAAAGAGEQGTAAAAAHAAVAAPAPVLSLAPNGGAGALALM